MNGAQIFSYINIKNAFTKGGEFEFNYQTTPQLKISTGYQYLLTADKEELTNIKAGKVYTRNTDGTSRLLSQNEYAGLPNRSKHMANLKFAYESKSGNYATARFMYRSRWYVADSDGNGVYNSNDEHANGFILANISAGTKIKKGIKIYTGIDNLLNQRDAVYLPNMQGRMIYLGMNFKIK